MKKFILITVVSFVVLAAIFYWAYKDDAKKSLHRAEENVENLDQIGQVYDNQGQDHIAPGEEHPPYNSNPPTSGWHWVQAASWGIYNKPLIDEQAVHNLEHGGIWISYKDIDEETLSQLKKIAKANAQSVILSPRDENDSKIVLASWLHLEQMDEYDETRILEFISRNKNNSPEPFAQ